MTRATSSPPLVAPAPVASVAIVASVAPAVDASAAPDRWFADGLFVASENDLYLYGSEGRIERSTDGGKSFVPQTTGITDDVLAMTRSRGALWALHAGGVIRSRDGGASWTESAQTKNATVARAMWSSRSIDGVYFAGDGAFAKMSDDGNGWASVAESRFDGDSVSAMWGASANDLYVLASGTDARGVVRYEMYECHDAAATVPRWKKANLGPHGQLFAIGGTSAHDVYVTGTIESGDEQMAVVFHRANGASWSQAKVGAPMLVSIWTAKPNDVYLGTAWRGLGGSILHTADGHKWTTVRDGLVDVEAVGGTDAGAVFVLSGRAQLLRNDGETGTFVELSPAVMGDP